MLFHPLPAKLALCSKRFSLLHREHIERHPEMKVIGAKMLERHRPQKSSAQWAAIARRAKGTPARQNVLGLCALQMRARWEVVEKIVGREPSYKDLFKHDRVLLGRIVNVGTLNDYRRKIGRQTNSQGPIGASELEVIAALRKWAHAHGRRPSTYRWVRSRARPCVEAVFRVFGSWEAATAAAGV